VTAPRDQADSDRGDQDRDDPIRAGHDVGAQRGPDLHDAGVYPVIVGSDVMGTHASVHVMLRPGAPAQVAAAVRDASNHALAVLHEADRRFSPFRDDSEVCRLASGDLAIEAAHPDVHEVAAACRAALVATDGLFDAWWRGWFDPTGYVKGWAADRAAVTHLFSLLADDNVVAVGLNVGGDLTVATAPGADWRWRVGIADPTDRSQVLATLELSDGGVATSGTAERGAHIVDPRTGEPAGGVQSVTVVADTLAVADLWATTAVIAGAGDLGWIANAGTRSGLLVGTDGRIRRWAGPVEIDLVDASISPAAIGT
jgi:thiamine biosynthesis lipoprotein